ncbi:MAG: hypothetical protein K2I49_01210 [Ureaplasma sp.]|nr:hypothetical protein [Ureaplasma sp.]
MNRKNKILLGVGLSLAPLVIATPLLVTSCNSGNNEQDKLANTYQRQYQKEMSLFLDSNKKDIVTITNSNNTISQSYCTFQDLNSASPTYKGWYLLLRDTSNNDEIIASFCGWNDKYLRQIGSNKPDVVDNGYSIPDTILLPNNYSISGLSSRNIPIKAIGVSNQMQGFNELSSRFSSEAYFLNNILFFDIDFSLENPRYDDIIVEICVPKYLDLQNNKIMYIFDNIGFTMNRQDESTTTIIFPETLLFLGSRSIDTTSGYKNVIFDFSHTNLVEIEYLSFLNDENLEIKLPKSCVRISRIDAYSPQNLNINLENVLYYEYYYMNEPSRSISAKSINNKTNEVFINKDAKYFSNSFSNGFEIKFFE